MPHVAMLSKALVVGAYQRKSELLAAEVRSLRTWVPAHWGLQKLERAHVSGYVLRALPIRFGNNYHLHHYPTLAAEMRAWQAATSDGALRVVHIDEEPYNLATVQALRLARMAGARSVFFSWQNLNRRYPPPFSWFERYVLRNSDAAMVGSRESEAVWRAKGWRGPIHRVPQFGVDARWLAFGETRVNMGSAHTPFVVGYAGRLIHDKGLDLLLRACAKLPETQLRILGDGAQRAALEAQADSLGMRTRVSFAKVIPSVEMPTFYGKLDCLVLPSRTLPNWKEQFGRVLIEAMACGVPVIGSDSGEIPHVIGDAGQVFAEENADALQACIAALMQHPFLVQTHARAGLQRVRAQFTMQRIAQATAEVYRSMITQ